MFRYILVLLLVNASYRSLGNPINPSVPSLANSLAALAGRCKNAFLTNEINSKLLYCSDLSSPHGEKQLQCLIFYDINRQLCEAIGTATLDLPEVDYTAKINEEQDVNSLCLNAKEWVFSNLTELLRYKQAADKIFKHPVTCGKICGVEDFLSDDSNFFCKYFNWGAEMLKHKVIVTTTTQVSVINAQLPAQDVNVESKPNASAQSNSDLQDLQIKTMTDSKVAPSKAPIQHEVAAEGLQKPETSSTGINQSSQLPESSLKEVSVPDKPDTNVDKIEDTGAMPESVLDAAEKPSKSPEDPKVDSIPDSGAKLLEAPEHIDTKVEDDVKSDVDKDVQLLNTELEHKEPVIDNPKVKEPGEVDDYQDSEEGKEGLADTQGGDDGDAEDPILADLDTKPEEEKPVEKIAETIVSTFTGQQDFYANPVEDAFPEDDDHFFPLFLTAVILVVLLYVLYHNKNKVGKVFFGLVLEGRQANRRRNSRGHSYRRLDTLEQAMSANTTAPPSKIIY